jgi:hypothetical protein
MMHPTVLRIQEAFKGDVDRAIDALFAWGDDMYFEGRFEEVEQVLVHLIGPNASEDMLYAIACVAGWARDKLLRYHELLDSIERYYPGILDNTNFREIR